MPDALTGERERPRAARAAGSGRVLVSAVVMEYI
jgi:hypothetical protein